MNICPTDRAVCQGRGTENTRAEMTTWTENHPDFIVHADLAHSLLFESCILQFHIAATVVQMFEESLVHHLATIPLLIILAQVLSLSGKFSRRGGDLRLFHVGEQGLAEGGRQGLRGKSPQNGTERVSVTSAKTFFFP